MAISHGRTRKKTDKFKARFDGLRLILFCGFKGGKLLPSLSVRATASAVPVLCLASVFSQKVPMLG